MAITTKRIIEVITRFKQEGLEKFNKAARKNNEQITKQQRAFADATKKGKRHKETMRNNTIANAGFAEVMGMNVGQLGKFNTDGRKMTTLGGRMANKFRMMTHGARGFRMEMLGVMFFGMALTRIFTGLTRTSMEWMGVTDILSSALGLLFLPIAEKVTDWALKFLDWVDSLTEEQKEWIGSILLVVGALGLIFAVIGTIALGIGSLILVFGKLFGVAAPIKALGAIITGVFGTITAPIIAIVAIIIAVVIGMYLAWKTNFLGMKKTVQNFIDGFKQWFGGIIGIVKGIIDIVKGIFTGDFELVKKGIMKIFKGLFDFLVGGFKAAFNLVVGIVKGALMIIYNIVKVIIDGIGWIVGKVGKLFGGSGAPAWKLPSFQTGGIVPNTGLALVHKGERVIPAGQVRNTNNNVSPTINISANVSSDYDVRRLAEELKRYWVSDFERVSQGRSS